MHVINRNPLKKVNTPTAATSGSVWQSLVLTGPKSAGLNIFVEFWLFWDFLELL